MLCGAATDADRVLFSFGYLQAVGIAALATQLARKEQRRLVQKTIRSEGVYFLPHSPILAPIMVICYATVGLATLFVLKAFLWQGSAVAVIQRVSACVFFLISLATTPAYVPFCLALALAAYAAIALCMAFRMCKRIRMASHTSGE